MNDKKPDDYKVSWGSWNDVWEILVHIALAICVIYAVYSFFHQEETESDTVEKAKVENQDQASGGYRTKLEHLNPKSKHSAAAAS